MGIVILPEAPLLIIASHLLEDPRDFVSFRKICKKFKGVTEHKIFEALEMLWKKTVGSEDRLWQITAPDGLLHLAFARQHNAKNMIANALEEGIQATVLILRLQAASIDSGSHIAQVKNKLIRAQNEFTNAYNEVLRLKREIADLTEMRKRGSGYNIKYFNQQICERIQAIRDFCDKELSPHKTIDEKRFVLVNPTIS